MLTTGNALFDLAFLLAATRGTPVGEPAGNRIVTDTRDEVREALFLALSGPRFDGHDFVEDAMARGAGGAVVSASWWGETGAGRVNHVFVVPDTLLALQDLARAHRRRHLVPLAAVTGSNGKTTTKEFLAAALRPLGPVHKTAGNRNNHIGLPLTLLDLSSRHRAAVVEIGLNHPGELRLLSEIARPRVGVITSVSLAHLEGLATLEGVARAKAEIAVGLEPSGTLVVPAGVPLLHRALAGFGGSRVTFGLGEDADLHPLRIQTVEPVGYRMELPGGIQVEIGLAGAHNLINALAALAAARAMGVPLADAARELIRVRPLPGRLAPRSVAGMLILDDTYNANPASLTAALAVLRERKQENRRCWAILGDMLELGEDAAQLHRRSGEEAAFVDGLITVGTLAEELGRGAVAAGLSPDRVHAAESGESAADLLLPELGAGDVVLVKGSRGMHLETAVRRLLEKREGKS